MEELEHAQQEEAFFTVESVITPKDYRALYYFNTVSYTHLDVYKRQASACSGRADGAS